MVIATSYPLLEVFWTTIEFFERQLAR